MIFKDVLLDEFKIIGFIDFVFKGNRSQGDGDIEYSSWGNIGDNICPYCGEDHSIEAHREINWEELYPTHNLLKQNMHLLLKESGNLVNKDKKYEIIKFGEDINDDTPSYNIVGLMVKDLNVMPPNFTGMRFPKKKYKAITLTMEEYMTSKEFENELHNNKDLENYFIIEYDLNEKIEYSKLLVTVYYPIKG